MDKIKAVFWRAEINCQGSGWRKLASGIAVLSAILVPIALTASFHLLDYLGPGLGDDTGYHYLTMVMGDLEAAGHTRTLVVFILALIALLCWRGWFIYLAYADYRKNNALYPNELKQKGEGSCDDDWGFPLNTFFLFVFFNVCMLLGAAALFAVFGLIAKLGGFTFVDGYAFVKNMVATADHLAKTHVPTLVDLPPFLAVICIYAVTGFFHYWLHRLAHQFRLLWLLLHRPHHMPDTLMEPLTTGVVVAFPVGFLVMFPYVFLFGACGKLFSAEPIFFEVLVFNLIVNIANISAHSTSLYHIGFRHKWIGFLGHLFGGAQYHYVHHASHPLYSRQNTNLVNIGAGPFMLWDRVFGTYVEPPLVRPEIGLTGQPTLYKNPVRLLFAGIFQIAYELKENRGWKERVKIVFGPSDYTPPVSKDFALRT
ncbi:MAG: sterol desaturase family protein [Pseudomonadales bacterium]|nr:sterol desaturase family protein [Pseudomonadales bacterium]